MGPAERSVGQQTAVFAREGDSLLDALIDDQIADFRQPINVRLAGAEIAAFDRVVKETEDAIAVVLIIFGGIDSTLGGDAMGAARAVLVAETFHAIAELAQRGGRCSAGQAAPHDNDLEFPAIGRTDQARVILMRRPFVRQRSRRDLGVQTADHSCWAGFTKPSRTATGIDV